MRPTIGITMCIDKGYLVKGRPGIVYDLIRHEYGEQVSAAGGTPIFLDTSTDPREAARLCDGIVISGGQDIDPAFYGGRKATKDEHLEPRERTEWEKRLIAACDKRGVPILGICYGAQLLNLYYGGSLQQDIASEVDGSRDHGGPFHQVIHEIRFEHAFLGFSAGDEHPVAARHHQAVRDVAPGFKVVARAEDGVIEAIAGRGHYGVQWHAEADATAGQIYAAFVNACNKRSLPKYWAKSWQQVRTRTRPVKFSRRKPKTTS